MPDRRKPAYDLDAFRTACRNVDRLRMTTVALRGAAALGFGRAEIVATIGTMNRSHFYKSTTSYRDHRVWQDVYHVPSEAGVIYVKFTADTVTGFLLLSFKERDDA
jgi:motility quorum-sensing regulator/GCU-specific mRNA interferase toxin